MINALRNIAGGRKLLASRLYSEKSFYGIFLRDLKNAKRGVVIESPYLTERRARYFARIFNVLSKRGIKIRVNTRRPKYHSQAMKMQAEAATKILLANGVKIYAYDDLRHRKLAMIDNRILWEGSLNILSHSKSKEIMRRTNSPYLCRQMMGFIQALK